MGVQVNKPGSNNRPIGIDDLIGDAVCPTTYPRDATVLDPHVTSKSRHSCPIDDGAVFYVNVVLHTHVSPRVRRYEPRPHQ